MHSVTEQPLLVEKAVLVVPPFECAWLSGEELTLRGGKGCITLEVKGDNDVTVILKQQSGSRRWQHLASGAAPPRGGAASGSGRGSPVERNYTVILGSHRNSCLKFEKDGELCCQVANAPGARVSNASFVRYWINYEGGAITVGTGAKGSWPWYCWTDPDPIESIRFVGLSAWDKHVGYRDIRIEPPVDLRASRQAGQEEGAVSSLFATCCSALRASLGDGIACASLEAGWRLAPAPCCTALRDAATAYVARRLEQVAAADPAGFAALSAPCLGSVLQSQELALPEKSIFDTVMAWAAASSSPAAGLRRQGSSTNLAGASPSYSSAAVGGADGSAGSAWQPAEELLQYIRFPLMTDAELQEVGRHPLYSISPTLRGLVAEAQNACLGGSAGRPPRAPGAAAAAGGSQVRVRPGDRHLRAARPDEAAARSRFVPRRPPGATAELQHLFDGDHNGLCWYLGTAHGTQPWVNPALAGRLEVRASSPSCRGTSPQALVSGQFSRTNAAGPRREPGGALASWWTLDLGPAHRLACNHYSLRQDGSRNFLRSWALQGSLDGQAWVDLRRHAGDSSLSLPGQCASWVVGGPAAAVSYRWFRVLVTEPQAESEQPLHICLSNIELYGWLYISSDTSSTAENSGERASAA